MDEALERISREIGEPAPVGRPLGSFKLSVEEVRDRIQGWMDSFKEGGERKGETPTVSSLGFDLGLSRMSIINYQNRDAFRDLIERAKTFCEMHVAQKLFDPKVRPAGPIFNLKANFGWKDGSEPRDINFNFSWNAVQIEAEKVRKQLEEPDHTKI